MENGDNLSRLQREVEEFSGIFPGLSIRFCRIMGRRVSHLAGDTSRIRTGEYGLPITKGLVAYVEGDWKGLETELEDYALRLASSLSE